VIYFDHNATSPISAVAKEAWLSAVERFSANPSSPHRPGSRAEVALTAARQEIAAHLGCSEFDLVFTSGATEANNAVFYHVSREQSGEVWISAIEHPSVIAAAERWFPNRVKLLKVTPAGEMDLNHLEKKLKQTRPALVALMAANNETGVLQPWEDARELCAAHGVLFFCDAAQWIGKETATGLGSCDFISGCAHKFGGPVGIGFLKAPPDFKALIVGGPQQEGRRAGTENVASALSMTAAWAEREQQLEPGHNQERANWRDAFVKQLQAALPGLELLGLRAPRLWNTVAALMPPIPDCRRRWVVQMDKLGFAVSTGSACASGKQKPSHVLTAMGYDPSVADRMLRFSAGWDTTEQDWQSLLDGIQTAFAELNLK
jgi:cysteine desulfurase